MSQEVREPKKVILSVLKKQVEEGMKKDELAKFYGLPVMQMTKLLKSAGLEIRKFRRPSFVLINDTEEVTDKVVDNVATQSTCPKDCDAEIRPERILQRKTVKNTEENITLAESAPYYGDPVEQPSTEADEEIEEVITIQPEPAAEVAGEFLGKDSFEEERSTQTSLEETLGNLW